MAIEKDNRWFFNKLKKGLEKTRNILFTNVDDLILGERKIDQELFDELEESLIMADVGPVFANDMIDKVKDQVRRNELNSASHLKQVMHDRMVEILARNESQMNIARGKLFVIMVVGVNGTGKTTTIGKLANNLKQNGRNVMIVAADTFRAAAIEQLEIWSQRVGVPIIKQKMDSDPSAVVFDAISAAKTGRADTVIIDTAGRLHTKTNLMDELKKMKRIIAREISDAPHEVMLVLDATTGQNAVNQAKIFKDEIGVTGLVLTKLDATAKGGVIIRIAMDLDIPIRYIGIGEGLDDLREFKSKEFVDALFNENTH
ncbi:MAG: signal recognition particle-docking protein FtsY [Deltaproteobacteria bacterium]|nr:signal recognition particle-docking protein FtsY [Deltaproteobacteria bacterium]